MPMVDVGGCPINVVVEGREGAPVLMLSNSLGTDHHMWDPQMAEFTKHFRVVRYDRRGHGKSGKPKGPYTMERLGRDVVAILDALNIKKINWCGLSMGGMVGQWLGANAAERIDKLVLANTNSYYADRTPWAGRIKMVREQGFSAFADMNMERWLGKSFRDAHPEQAQKLKDVFLAGDKEGYIACVEAIREMDHRALLPKIKAPTLIIAGKNDAATTVEMAEYLRDHIPGAKMVVLDAAHISNIEQSAAFTKAVLDFLRA